jgi:hypothetical protein
MSASARARASSPPSCGVPAPLPDTATNGRRARGRSTAGTTSGPSCSISTASAEAVHHNRVRLDGNVDHLWIRVADVAASKRF